MALEKKLRQSFVLIIYVTYLPLLSKKSPLSLFSLFFALSSIYIITISFSEFIKCFLRVSCMAAYISEAVWWYAGKDESLKARKT